MSTERAVAGRFGHKSSAAMVHVGVLAAILAGAAPGTAGATTFVVTTAADGIGADGQVSLREAVTAANTNAPSGDAPAGSVGFDAIRFAPSLSGTIFLGSALPAIGDELLD